MKTTLRLLLSALLPWAAFPAVPAMAKSIKESLSKSEGAALSAIGLEPMELRAMDAESTSDSLKEARTQIAQIIKASLGGENNPFHSNDNKPTDFSDKEKEYLKARAKEGGVKNQYERIVGRLSWDQSAQPFVAAMRKLILKDLSSYDAAKGKFASSDLTDVIKKYKYTASSTDKENTPLSEILAAANQALAGPSSSEEPKAETCKFADKVKDSLECAMTEALINKEGTGITDKNIGTDDARKFIKAWLGYHMTDQGFKGKNKDGVPKAVLEDLEPILKKHKIDTGAQNKYYCDKTFPNGTAGAAPSGSGSSETKPLAQLKALHEQLANASGAPSSEALKTIDAYSGAIAQQNANRCQAHFNAEKAAQLNTGGGSPSLTVTEPPAVTPDVAEKAPEKKDGPAWKKIAIGAGVGAIGFGILGLVLGGPVGMMIGAALGAAAMGGVTHLRNS